MTTKNDKTVLKWYTLRSVRMTSEYGGGLIAGFGLGVVVLAWVMSLHLIPPYWHTISIPGFAFMAMGSLIAHHAQGRYVDDDAQDDPPRKEAP
jgi:hypothetical protein